MKKLLIISVLVTLSTVQAIACAGITKKGTICKRAPMKGSQYCSLHIGQAAKNTTENSGTAEGGKDNTVIDSARCKATTKKGAQCKRKASVGSEYCAQHSSFSEKSTTLPDVIEKPIASQMSNTNRTQCVEMKSDGTQCTRKAQPGETKCWQHANK